MPRCAASRDSVAASLTAFAIRTLECMEQCNGTADACIALDRALYWAAVGTVAHQSAGRAVVSGRVRSYAESIRATNVAQDPRA